MSPETGLFFDKARKLLAEAAIMLTVDLNEAAARTAYLAGFHAAQAFISEKLAKAIRTHKGVQAELYRLTKDDPAFPADLWPFLSHTSGRNGRLLLRRFPSGDGRKSMGC